uniref:Tripartite motif-containing protein 16-like n=1 Tax=Hucho hucho TaxID=62062 RepID=A0A4W5LJ41_9TELE
MAQQGVLLDKDQFCCSVCPDLLKEPVTTACGHSYCRSCIEGYWDQDHQGIYSCPQCRQTFTPRPSLRKNNMLAEVVETLKKTGLQAAPPALCYKALMSCLVCLVSYCETHLQPHYESPGFKKHKLVKATAQLEEKICSHHDKLLEVYCRTDQQCICLLCIVDEHKGHDTVSAAAERTEKQVRQELVGNSLIIKDIHSAKAAVEDSERIFTELIRSMERRHSEVKDLIRAQEKAEVSRVQGLLEQMEQEIVELRKRDDELKQLSPTEDHILFLKVAILHFFIKCSKSLYATPTYFSLSFSPFLFLSLSLCPLQYFGDPSLYACVIWYDDNIVSLSLCECVCGSVVNTVEVLLPPEPKTREQFLQYSCQLSLDLNTAHKYLSLSEGNRKVTHTNQEQPYPDHPDRVSNYCEVLCKEGLSGCCYWEVKWSGGTVHIAVSYKDIKRKEYDDSLFGYNDKCWCLDCSSGGYSFIHNKVETKVSGPQSSRVGVYLDHKAGTLSFYSVSDTMTLLHRVQPTFTQPLYPGFWVRYQNDSAELCELWQSSPY